MNPGKKNHPLRVLVIGARGRMGQSVVEAMRGQSDMVHAGSVEVEDDLARVLADARPDVAVDFTTAEAATRNIALLIEQRVHPVVGTTGIPDAVLETWRERSREAGLGGLLAPNFAIGAVLMMELARQAARHLREIEIIEFHHEQKRDAPSGTSLRTRALLETELGTGHRPVPIHSVRLPGFLAHQEVILGGPGERLTIRHDSIDRKCFMPGVLLAIRRVGELREMVVGLEHILALDTA